MEAAHTHQFLIQPLSEGQWAGRSDEVRALWAARKQERDPERKDSGVDIPLPAELVVPPMSECSAPVMVNLGVRALCLCAASSPGGRPQGAPFRMLPRSSIARTMLILANSEGVFEMDYRGPVRAVFHNLGSVPLRFPKGTCLVQLLTYDGLPPACSVLDDGDPRARAFTATARGAAGFGSSGSAAAGFGSSGSAAATAGD